ncbi:MAG: hypothetical protein M1837_006527 [Sclerophora amabilis]|nr:MAG: hypothetical protein M1837_006527 [Sclerophora amabilis]
MSPTEPSPTTALSFSPPDMPTPVYPQNADGSPEVPTNSLARFCYGADDPWVPHQRSAPASEPKAKSSQFTIGVGTSPSDFSFGPYRDTARSDTGSYGTDLLPSDSGYARSFTTASVFSGDQMELNQHYDSISGHLGNWQHLDAPPTASHLLKPAEKPRPIISRDPGKQEHKSSRSSTAFSCLTCGSTFNCQSQLKKHRLRHEKPYKCEIPDCARTDGFSTSNDRDRHVKSVHKIDIPDGTTKTWLCQSSHCKTKDKIWPRLDNFKAHLKRMHPQEDLDDLLFKSEQRSAFENSSQFVPENYGMLSDPPTAFSMESLYPSGGDSGICTTVSDMTIPPDSSDEDSDRVNGIPNVESFEAISVGNHAHRSPSDVVGGLRRLNCSVSSSDAPSLQTKQQEGSQIRWRPQKRIGRHSAYAQKRRVGSPSQISLKKTQNEDPKGNMIEDPSPLEQPGPRQFPPLGSTEVSHRQQTLPSKNSKPPAQNPRETLEDTEMIERVSKEIATQLASSIGLGGRCDSTTYLCDGTPPACEAALHTDPGSTYPMPKSVSLASPKTLSSETGLPSNRELIQPGLSLDQSERTNVETHIQELIRALLLHHRAPTEYPSTERDLRDSESAVNSAKSRLPLVCSKCPKRCLRPCDMKKHKMRHDRPYGCTYPRCNRVFGSKNDWKRHENSQHFQLEMWRCHQKIQECPSKQCAKVFYRRENFQQHLRQHHGITEMDQLREEARMRRIGRNGQNQFWCGFCTKIIPLQRRGLEAFDERFNHIGKHFKEKTIDQWISVDSKEPKGKHVHSTSDSQTGEECDSDQDSSHPGLVSSEGSNPSSSPTADLTYIPFEEGPNLPAGEEKLEPLATQPQMQRLKRRASSRKHVRADVDDANDEPRSKIIRPSPSEAIVRYCVSFVLVYFCLTFDKLIFCLAGSVFAAQRTLTRRGHVVAVVLKTAMGISSAGIASY